MERAGQAQATGISPPGQDRGPHARKGATEALCFVDPTASGDGASPGRKALLEAVGTYIRRLMNDEQGDIAENIHSPRFGASDLLYVNHAAGRLICAKLDDGCEGERFLLAAISYYLWLREVMCAARSLFHVPPTLDMFFFLNRIPAGAAFMLEKLRDNLQIHLVRYRVLPVGASRGTALYFEHLFGD